MPHDAKGHKQYDFGMRRLRGLGFGVIVVALTVGVIAGVVTAVQHIPRPEKKIEWVQRPDAIIVQMRVNGFQLVESNGMDPYVIVPEFTLYGDGTLIASKTGSECPCSLIEAMLSEGEVRDLLRYIDDSGFFDFSYIEPGGPESDPTTYIYAARKDTQNISGRHFALHTCFGDCTPPSRYRTLGEIEARLEQVIKEAASNGTATDYWADAIVLSAKVTNVTIRSTPPPWPLSQVDLKTIAHGSEIGRRRIEGDLARQIQQALAEYRNETDYLVGEQWYAAGYTPVLPYEDHFPEFDTTQ
jgi:hypothetical protein